MKRRRIVTVALRRIHRPKSSSVRVVIPSTQVVELQIGIILLTSKQIAIRRTASASDQISEGVVVVRIRYLSQIIGEVANIVVAVVTIEAREPGRAFQSVLADQGMTVRVNSVNGGWLIVD